MGGGSLSKQLIYLEKQQILLEVDANASEFCPSSQRLRKEEKDLSPPPTSAQEVRVSSLLSASRAREAFFLVAVGHQSALSKERSGCLVVI